MDLFPDLPRSANQPDSNANRQSTRATLGVKSNWKRDYNSSAHDYYATTPLAAELLLTLDWFSDIWECCSGGGHLAEVFDKHGLLARYSDIIDYGNNAEIIDFVHYRGGWHGDIITNPPYKFATEMAYNALRILHEGRKLALLLPTRYLSGQERRRLFDRYPLHTVWISSSRSIYCALNGNFNVGTGNNSAIDYAWFVWHKGYNGSTSLRFFN
jgi:hypothetical protein